MFSHTKIIQIKEYTIQTAKKIALHHLKFSINNSHNKSKTTENIAEKNQK